MNSQDKLIPELRSIYEQLGYKKYKMSKFEEYDLYLENKSFLKSENIITFNDLNGKLLALKPDVTLSIVKNSGDYPQKLYYTENVYRVKSGQYKEIMQVGLEYLGKIDLYTICEVLRLASKSLETISTDYILDISHMGFLSGLLEEFDFSKSEYEKALGLISQKDAHELKSLCEIKNTDSALTDKLVKLATMYGGLGDMLPEIALLNVNDKTDAAYKELNDIYNTLKATGYDSNINLDFSIINDMSYYNGVIFQGFIKGIADNVLSGGRYDNLLSKFGKKAEAIGFAIYFDMLEYFMETEAKYDVDVMLTYGENADTTALTKAINMLIGTGQTVLAATEIPKNLRYKQLLAFNERGLEILETND